MGYTEAKDGVPHEHPIELHHLQAVDAPHDSFSAYNEPSSKRTQATTASLDTIAGSYDQHLTHLRHFFYTEVKFLDTQTADATSSTEVTTILHHKSLLLSRLHTLQSIEHRLTPTIRFSLLEFALCSIACIALGILLNVETSGASYTIASIFLLGAHAVYSAVRYAASMRGAWGKWSEEDYTRLFEEARRAAGEGRVAEAG
jgi:hypothetical protein